MNFRFYAPEESDQFGDRGTVGAEPPRDGGATFCLEVQVLLMSSAHSVRDGVGITSASCLVVAGQPAGAYATPTFMLSRQVIPLPAVWRSSKLVGYLAYAIGLVASRLHRDGPVLFRQDQ